MTSKYHVHTFEQLQRAAEFGGNFLLPPYDQRLVELNKSPNTKEAIKWLANRFKQDFNMVMDEVLS